MGYPTWESLADVSNPESILMLFAIYHGLNPQPGMPLPELERDPVEQDLRRFKK